MSAVANAENNFDLDVENLVVSEAFVNEGPTMKRFRPRAKGSASNQQTYKSYHGSRIRKIRRDNQWVKKYIQLECV